MYPHHKNEGCRPLRDGNGRGKEEHLNSASQVPPQPWKNAKENEQRFTQPYSIHIPRVYIERAKFGLVASVFNV